MDYEAFKDFYPIGRMMSASKSDYNQRFPYPTGWAVFNANVCTKEDGKIWFGDIDVIRNADKLKTLATRLGKVLYVLREMDARFDTEANPDLNKAVAIIVGDEIEYNKKMVADLEQWAAWRGGK